MEPRFSGLFNIDSHLLGIGWFIIFFFYIWDVLSLLEACFEDRKRFSVDAWFQKERGFSLEACIEDMRFSLEAWFEERRGFSLEACIKDRMAFSLEACIEDSRMLSLMSCFIAFLWKWLFIIVYVHISSSLWCHWRNSNFITC